MSVNNLIVNKQDKILHLSFNRPNKKNAISAAMYTTLIAALEDAKNDIEVHVVLIRGEQDMFTAGNDLDDFNTRDFSQKPLGIILLETLHHFEKPIVVAVAGIAVGVGATMLLHCDLVYAAKETRFRLPFINLGVVPEGASSYLLPERIGHQRAARLLMLGEFFNATEAIEYGFVTEQVDLDEVYQTALYKAQTLSQLPQPALKATKALMKQHTATTVSQTITTEARIFAEMLQTPESKALRSNTLKEKK